MPSPAQWKTAGLHALLALLTLAAVSLQLRLSLETVQFQRSVEFYVPFLVEPFTARIFAAMAQNWEKGTAPQRSPALRRGDTLVKVNGKPFSGYALYLAELRRVQLRPEGLSPLPPPFWITVRRKDGQFRDIEMSFPHCTCGIPGLFDTLFFWVGAPLFCISIGAITVALRPRALLPWMWFAGMLSLSQLQYWTEPSLTFQWTTDPMAIAGAMRVPAVAYREFVQCAWPAALTLAAISLAGRRRPHPLQLAWIGAILLFALARSAVAVAWSEGWQPMAPLFFFLKHHDALALAMALISATVAAWVGSPRLGLLAAGIALCAFVALFAAPAPVTQGVWEQYSNNTTRFVATAPRLERTPGAVTAASVTLFILLGFALYRRRLSWLPFVASLLCLPLAIHVVGSRAALWAPFQEPPIAYGHWIPLLTAGPGLTLLSRWIIRRSPSP
jgi:hypothetical protein